MSALASGLLTIGPRFGGLDYKFNYVCFYLFDIHRALDDAASMFMTAVDEVLLVVIYRTLIIYVYT